MKFLGHTIPVMIATAPVFNVPSDKFVFWIDAIPPSHPNDNVALFANTLPLSP